jgi:hypothetical protein
MAVDPYTKAGILAMSFIERFGSWLLLEQRRRRLRQELGRLTICCASRECAVPLGRFSTERLAVLCIALRDGRTVEIGFGGLGII